jgi:hypothetical protein
LPDKAIDPWSSRLRSPGQLIRSDGQALRHTRDCLYRRTFLRRVHLLCAAAAVDVLLNRAVMYSTLFRRHAGLQITLRTGSSWGWEAFMADGRPPALIEALRNRSCSPLSRVNERKVGVQWTRRSRCHRNHRILYTATRRYHCVSNAHVCVFIASYGDWGTKSPRLS